jgi:type VI secretion system protein ImpF
MARIRSEQPLLPSVLDRLIDEDPTTNNENPRSRNQVLHELKQSVRRDLENLLNTRWRCSQWPPALNELDVSLVNYGIPDFTGVNMGGPDNRVRMRRIIERVIKTFEPRFVRVNVKLLENSDSFDQTLRFQVDGLLHAEPAPEPVVFDTLLQPTSSEFEVVAK